MLSIRIGPKQTRMLQRRVHLLAGLLVVVYIYLAPGLDSAISVGVRWLVLPALALSGLAMWQWPRLRRLARRRQTGT